MCTSWCGGEKGKKEGMTAEFKKGPEKNEEGTQELAKKRPSISFNDCIARLSGLYPSKEKGGGEAK